MNKMKKYILFIVEGKNDRTEIHSMLRAYCSDSLQNRYHDLYYCHSGDITVDETEKTIVKKLNEIVISWRKGKIYPFHPFSIKDVAKVVHVIDTDGVFIPESAIIEDDVGKVEYYDKTIKCGNRSVVVGRNRKKAKALRKLLTVKTIDNIPYELFFASCNMDHVLFGTANMAPELKGPSAREFADICKNPEDLDQSVFNSNIRSDRSLVASWDYVQLGYNSLKRHTNLNILLDDLSK